MHDRFIKPLRFALLRLVRWCECGRWLWPVGSWNPSDGFVNGVECSERKHKAEPDFKEKKSEEEGQVRKSPW